MNIMSKTGRCITVVLLGAVFVVLATTSVLAQERTESEETIVKTDDTGDTTVSSVKVVKTSNTEDIRELKNMLLINPIKFINLFNASYYRGIGPNLAVGGTLQTPTVLLGDEASGFGLAAEVLYYTSGKLFRGFHLGGYISYDVVTYRAWQIDANGGGSTQEVTEHPFSVGGYMGWNMWLGNEFVTELVFGAEYNANPTSEAILSLLGDKKGIIPYFALKVGHAW